MPFVEVFVGMFGIFAVGLGLGHWIGRTERDNDAWRSANNEAKLKEWDAQSDQIFNEQQARASADFYAGRNREDSARRSQS